MVLDFSFYGISPPEFSSTDVSFGKSVIIFGNDMNSSVHTD